MTQPTDLPDFTQSVGGIETLLFQADLGHSVPNNIPVGAYGSVQIILANVDGTSFLDVQYQFFDTASGFPVDQGLLSADCNLSVVGDSYPCFELPVRANQLKLMNRTAGNITAIVIGRPETRRRGMASAYFPARSFQGNVPALSASGTRVQLPGLDGNAPIPVIRDCSNYNGEVTLAFVGSGAITGSVQIGYMDRTATRQFQTVAVNPGTATTQLQIGHPFAFTTWWFQCTATSPSVAVAVKVVLVPSETDG